MDRPICLVFYGTDEEEDKFLDYFAERTYSPTLSLILYLVRRNSEESANFPINSLRNLGIQNTFTSHYIVFDMDVWPARNLYVQLASLPTAVKKEERSLVIIPIFFYDLGVVLPQCKSLSNCTQLYVSP